MNKLATLLLLSAVALQCSAQSSEPAAPQTARQALLEMFFSKSAGTFIKHLPAATLAALAQGGAVEKMGQYSMLASQMHMNGSQLETFETGSVLLSTEDPKTGQKLEVVVESDTLRNDVDNIKVTFKAYKEKELQKTGWIPVLTFSMKLESGVWKLNEVDVNVRLPLTDPDFLKSITDMASKAAAAAAPTQWQKQAQFQNQMQTQNQMQAENSSPFQNRMLTSSAPNAAAPGPDASVIAAMRVIAGAENTYKATYHFVGYTCTLSHLDGFGSGEPNDHQAMLIPSSLASGRRYGFVFSLSGCSGSPAASFQLTAAPANAYSGRKAFCTDQSGAIRSSDDGNPDHCLASGTPVQ